MNDFRAKAVLSRTLAIWGKHVIPFSVLSLVCFIPDFIVNVSYIVALQNGLRIPEWSFIAVSTALACLLGLVVTSAVTYGTIQELRGRPATLGETISVGLGRILGVLGTAIIAGLAICIGTALLIIPGLVVSLTLFVAIPAAVVEKASSFGALRRSAELTQDHRVTIFAIVFWINLTERVVLKITEVLIANGLAGSPTISKIIMYSLFEVAAIALLAPFAAVASAVVYHELRRIKDGSDIEALAAVFD